jgi:hypothetical protein
VDAVSLINSGAIDALVPASAAWLLLCAPACGLVLITTTPFTGRSPAALVVAATVAGAATIVGLTTLLTNFEIGRLGPGALLAWLGLGAGLISFSIWIRAVKSRGKNAYLPEV